LNYGPCPAKPVAKYGLLDLLAAACGNQTAMLLDEKLVIGRPRDGGCFRTAIGQAVRGSGKDDQVDGGIQIG
jgi:hypothetical protein